MLSHYKISSHVAGLYNTSKTWFQGKSFEIRSVFVIIYSALQYIRVSKIAGAIRDRNPSPTENSEFYREFAKQNYALRITN